MPRPPLLLLQITSSTTTHHYIYICIPPCVRVSYSSVDSFVLARDGDRRLINKNTKSTNFDDFRGKPPNHAESVPHPISAASIFAYLSRKIAGLLLLVVSCIGFRGGTWAKVPRWGGAVHDLALEGNLLISPPLPTNVQKSQCFCPNFVHRRQLPLTVVWTAPRRAILTT